MIDQIGYQQEDKNTDSVMLEISQVIDEEEIKSISKKLQELRKRCATEASNTKNQIIRIISNKKHENREDGEESILTSDEEVSATMPPAKRNRAS